MEGSEFMEKIKREIGKAVVGREDVIELLLVALLSGGHVLLVGVPGIAKTTIAKSFARAIGLTFSRIQLTPDLMPADITGSVYFDQKESEFKIRKGPVFANIVLADEINRATPKTQSALLEAMQEGQVTIEGKTLELPKPFLLIATMNPVESESVYNLPEAQLDRFMIKIAMNYPERDEEITMLKRKDKGEFYEVNSVVSADDVLELMEKVRRVKVSDGILEYIYEIVRGTRTDDRVMLGASPRASEHLLFSSKALAFLNGRDYVLPDDVKRLAVNVLGHRVRLKPEYEVEGLKPEDVIRDVLDRTEIPK